MAGKTTTVYIVQARDVLGYTPDRVYFDEERAHRRCAKMQKREHWVTYTVVTLDVTN